MKDGLRCSGSIPYGYKREPGDKQTLVVDEPAAEVVRKIFRLVCQGVTTTGITEILTKEKVLIPSAYAALNQPKNCRHKEIADPYRWNATTIGYILDRQEYLGHTVLGKSICENFKTKQRRAATPDELMIFPDTHEAIIDQDTWDIARKIRSKKKPRVANGTYSHRLSGLVYCADCGSRMGFISPEANHSETHYDSDSAFQCGNYRSKSGECVSHYVKTSVLETAILQAIQAVSKYVLENEDEFIQQLKAVWNEQQTRTANNGYQELAEAKKRMAELDEKINKLYESTLSGLLPERQAQRMIQQYDEEQILLERRVAELEILVQQDEIKQVDASRFIALVKKYRDCEELTDTMLYAFIDRIEVHEATGGRTIYRQQNIDIHFNFIGNYYPPVEAVSEEERIAAIEAEQQRKKPLSYLLPQVGIIVVTGLSGIGAIALGEIIEKGLIALLPGLGVDIPILGSPVNLIGMLMGAIVCGVIGAIAINLINKQVAKQQKNENLSAQIDKKNEVLQTQDKLIKVKIQKMGNAKENAVRSMKDTSEQAKDIISEAMTTIFREDEEDHSEILNSTAEQGLHSHKGTMHLAFTGNPGTGKTTVARIVGRIYKQIGLLSKGHFVEVSRTDLIAGYQGQTALKVKKVIDEARGGVLFIDEAYSITENDHSDSYGRECLTELTKALEDYRDDLVVIVAGYTEPMNHFFASNPGLKSRFNTFIEFPDYSAEELSRMFFKLCKENDYYLSDNVEDHVLKILLEQVKNKKENFANGRLVRNIYDDVTMNHARRVVKMNTPSREDLSLITCDDFENIELDYRNDENTATE